MVNERLREELTALAGEPGRNRQAFWVELLAATVYVAGPAAAPPAVTQPETGRRAVSAFLTAAEAAAFWARVAPGRPAGVEAVAFIELAETAAKGVGAVVLDPLGASLVLGRAELLPLSRGEVPGEFGAWLREPARLGRQPAEVTARLRRAHVHVLVSKGPEPRIYLLEKSEDGTQAVPCFSGPETLAQFAEVRRLGDEQAVAVVPGEHCLQMASSLGAYVLIDPESPWETQVEPTLL